MRLRSFAATLATAGVIASLAAHLLRYSISPFAIAFFYLFVCLIAISRRLAAGQHIVYNIAFVFLALGMFELYQQLTDPYRTFYEGTVEESLVENAKVNFYVGDPDIRYSILPVERVVHNVKRSKDGSVIYDVKYSIDQHGLRKTPALESDKDVFFFGCSFTFGDGVNDNDTLPTTFSHLSGLHTLNFGVNGYGPHHMLRMLETDRSKSIEDNTPRVIVYT